MSSTESHSLQPGQLVLVKATGQLGITGRAERDQEGDVLIVNVDLGTHVSAFVPRELRVFA
jgi:hypothetical protein